MSIFLMGPFPFCCPFSGALLLSSGVMLQVCVGSMLIVGSNESKPSEFHHHKDGLYITNMDNKSMKIRTTKDGAMHLTTELLVNFHFLLLLINTVMFFFGASVMYTHVLAYAKFRGTSQSIGVWLMSVFAVSTVLGRIVLSVISQHPRVSTIWVYVLATFLCGKLLITNHQDGM